jgi:hypothetical protein
MAWSHHCGVLRIPLAGAGRLTRPVRETRTRRVSKRDHSHDGPLRRHGPATRVTGSDVPEPVYPFCLGQAGSSCATLPQWPRIKLPLGNTLRTQNAPVTRNARLPASRFLLLYAYSVPHAATLSFVVAGTHIQRAGSSDNSGVVARLLQCNAAIQTRRRVRGGPRPQRGGRPRHYPLRRQ